MYANPADFFIKLLSLSDDNKKEDEKAVRLTGWCDKWDQTGESFINEWAAQHPSTNKCAADTDIAQADTDIAQADSSEPRHKRISWFSEVMYLTRRSAIVNIRDPILLRARIMQTLVIGVVLGFLFFRLENTQQDSISKMGAMFGLLLNQTLVSGFGVANSFPKEKPIILSEVQGGVTRCSAYAISKMMADIPYQIVFPILFNTITYFLIGFHDHFGRFLLATLSLLLTAICGASLGYIGSAASSSGEEALQRFQLLAMPLALFSGFLVQSASLGNFWTWMEYISPFKHGMDGYSVAVFKDLLLDSDIFETGDEFLSTLFGIRVDRYWLSCVLLIVLFVWFRSMAVLAIFLTFK